MTKQEIFQILDSWENLDFLIKEIIETPKNYNALMEIALYSKDPKSWRAAYIVDKINDAQPELLHPFLVRMIDRVQKEKNGSKKRHFLKLISMNDIPENHQGVMFDFCLKTFSSSKDAVAVRVHAMQILYNISSNEPDLQPEILAIIEHEMEHHPSAGITSRGKKLANKLRLGNTIKG
jgi:hypothetical protein